MTDTVVSTAQSSDTLRHLKWDHEKHFASMSADEKLDEYVYLVSGSADETDGHFGVKVGLPSYLQIRRDRLHTHICYALGVTYTRAV